MSVTLILFSCSIMIIVKNNSQMNKKSDNSDRIKRSIIISKIKIMLPTVDILDCYPIFFFLRIVRRAVLRPAVITKIGITRLSLWVLGDFV